MKKLLRFMKGYRKEAIISPAFKLIEATFELLVPLVVAAMIDKGITAGNRGMIFRMGGLLVLLGVLGLTSTMLAQYFAAKAAVGFTARLRHVLFSHIQTLSFLDLDRQGTATLITRLTSDMNQIQQGMNLTLRLLLRSPFVVFGAMVMAFTIDVQAALVFVVTIPLLAAVVFGIMLCCIPLYKKVQQKLDVVLRRTRENLTGVRVIRAFCQEEQEETAFAAENEQLTRVQKFVGRISALMNPLTYVLINAAIIALIYTGALRVEAGLITQGAVVALYNYMTQILVELIKMANLIINITKSVACGNRVEAILEQQPTMTTRATMTAVPDKTAPAVEFCDVSMRYHPSGDAALSAASFTALPGQTIGVIGGTGSGKSTLVQLIPRFYDATEGTVRVVGVNVRDYTLPALRETVAVVPQKAVLFKGTIRENMRFGNEQASDAEIWDALRAAQAADVVAQKEGQLDFAVDQGGKNLSGGQRQRLTIARALLRHPAVLILDDSTSALDFATEAALRHALYQLPQKPAIFMVSQRTASLRRCDLILVLDDGRVVGQGTHEELLENCPVYREIHDSQFRKEEA